MKTMDRYPGLLQFTVSCLLSSIPRIVTRSPAALTEPVVYPFVTKCKSLPCVILIVDHVIVYHVLLSATPTSLSQAYAYSARNIKTKIHRGVSAKYKTSLGQRNRSIRIQTIRHHQKFSAST